MAGKDSKNNAQKGGKAPAPAAPMVTQQTAGNAGVKSEVSTKNRCLLCIGDGLLEARKVIVR